MMYAISCGYLSQLDSPFPLFLFGIESQYLKEVAIPNFQNRIDDRDK